MPKNEVILLNLDVKGQVKVHQVDETTHRSLPWCLVCVPFQTLSKKKGYIDEYGTNTPNSNTAGSLCQTMIAHHLVKYTTWGYLL